MLKTLVKKQLAEIFRSYFYDPKKNKARSKAAIIGFIVMFVVLMIGVLGGMFAFLSFSICQPMAEAGMNWMYFTLMGLLAIVLGTFGSVFNTYSGLYLSKDNDLLLSMPIPVGTIMTARLLGVYLMGLMYSGVVMLPAIIIYWIFVSASAAVIIGSLLLFALITVFVLTLSCALGWVVAKISLKLKNKSFVTVLASLVFFGLYYFVYFKAQSAIEDLVTHAADYGERIRTSAYPVYLFGRVGVGDPLAMLLVSATVLLLFFLTWWLISRSFLKMATATGNTEKKVYRETVAKKSGVNAALLKKEFRRFTSSANYMLNCGLGILMLVIGGVAFLLKGGLLVSIGNEIFDAASGFMPLLLCAMICLLASMNNMAAPSVSLEGKNLWIIQSLPVTPWQVLRAKLSVQLILTAVPVLFCLICVLLVYPFSPVEILVSVVITLLFVLFMALFDLFLGVKMPNIHWTNEVVPIKQSAPVGLALLVGFLYPVLLGGGFLLGGYRLGLFVYAMIFAAVTLLFSVVLFFWLKKRGSVILSTL